MNSLIDSLLNRDKLVKQILYWWWAVTRGTVVLIIKKWHQVILFFNERNELNESQRVIIKCHIQLSCTDAQREVSQC